MSAADGQSQPSSDLTLTPRPRGVTLLLLDAACVVVAYQVALLLRYDGLPPGDAPNHALLFSGFAVLVTGLGLVQRRLYNRVWREAGAADARDLLMVVGASTAVLALFDVTTPQRLVPASVPPAAGALIALMLGGTRFRHRLLSPSAPAAPVDGVIVVGSVGAARPVVEQLHRHPEGGARAVAIVTSAAEDWGRTLSGVPVVGPVDDLAGHVERFGAQRVLVARDDGQGAELAPRLGLQVAAVPTVQEVLRRSPRNRFVDAEMTQGLLNRPEAEIDLQLVRSVLEGRRVLITGAGGSIGSEIAAQVSALNVAELVLVDHDETHLHDACQRLPLGVEQCLGDIRDHDFVHRLFRERRPELVFHAAAHKHVPILESHPAEAVRTNVYGTHVLLEAAAAGGVKRFVAISTDKAVDPRNVMGASKRVAEELVVRMTATGCTFCAVRFGNVVGSRGSVVPTFARQIRAGGPVTVTHPEMTRFLMTTQEAVTLVLQAAGMAAGGEVFVLDMGEPVAIVDLAERMIRRAGLQPGRDVAIAFTGLRPGEKLHEELVSMSEAVSPTAHPKIAQVHGDRGRTERFMQLVNQLERDAWDQDDSSTHRLLFQITALLEHHLPRQEAFDELGSRQPLSLA